MLPTSIDAVPPAPRTPSPRARALIFRYGTDSGLPIILGAIFTVIGAVFVSVFAWGLPADIAIDLDGAQRQGHLISQEIDRNKTVNGRHPTMLRFSYSEGGKTYEGKSSTTGPLPHVDPDDGSIAIEVSRHFPSLSRAKGTMCSWAGYLSLITFLFPLVGLSQIYKGFAFHSRAVRAFTEGEPAMAKVVRAGQDGSVRVNGRMAFRVVWQFEVEGAPHQGSLHSMNRAEIDDLLQAKTLVVLYLPGNPRASTVYVDD